MALNTFAGSRADKETRLLQFVCDATEDKPARGSVIRMLADYGWLDADNEILFEAIHGLFARNSRDILDHLPAELTRRGFPDLSWEPLKQRSRLLGVEALALAGELLRAAK
ncbi:MAG TPA: hypothetical protein VMV59_02545 [Candidatus Dormibacteraeota bacterium]|nr:hypothetical protein [Candidatus Dormibacteraeota bacterium]